MKKIFLSLFVILSFGIYSFFSKNQIEEDVTVVAPNKNSLSTIPNNNPPAQNIQEKYINGEYTGDIVDAYYGNVQVKAIIKNGLIADVEFLDFPHDRQTSERISAQAIPLLTSEAIQAQDYKVDILSGATQTSNAFRESLKTALNKAH